MGGVAIRFAIANEATPELLAEARKLSHDRLIREVGPARAGPVTWIEYGKPEAYRILDQLEQEATNEGDPEAYATMRNYLETWPGATLVLATAEVA